METEEYNATKIILILVICRNTYAENYLDSIRAISTNSFLWAIWEMDLLTCLLSFRWNIRNHRCTYVADTVQFDSILMLAIKTTKLLKENRKVNW